MKALRPWKSIPKVFMSTSPFGGGGHSKAILAKINSGKLFAFDCDPDAETNVPESEQFRSYPSQFPLLAAVFYG